MKYYKKCYEDYYSCPDYRKKKRVERLDNDEEKVIYNCDKTEQYYLRSNIADFGMAITTHKSQGSEYDNVVVILAKSFRRMFYNKLIYTAITRAKSSLIIIGNIESLNLSVQTLYADNRVTYLKNV